MLSNGLFGNLLFIFSAFFVSAFFTVATVPCYKGIMNPKTLWHHMFCSVGRCMRHYFATVVVPHAVVQLIRLRPKSEASSSDKFRSTAGRTAQHES